MNRLRVAKTEDAQAIATWILEDKELLKHLQVGSEKEVVDFTKGLCELGNKGHAFVYEIHNKPVAIAALFASDYIKLKHHTLFQLMVSSTCRRQHIGSKLIEATVTLAKQLGVEQIDLELYESPWSGFFEKKGFDLYAVQERYVKLEDGSYLPRKLYRKEI